MLNNGVFFSKECIFFEKITVVTCILALIVWNVSHCFYVVYSFLRISTSSLFDNVKN